MSSNEKSSVPMKRPGKKKRDGMNSLFKETVPSRALEDCANNIPFVTTLNGETVYVGIMFSADDIGGLDRKTASKDQDKGQLIQIIEQGAIKTFFTEETLENEEILIIPDALSISNMEDYGMVRNLKYRIVYIHLDGHFERTDKTLTYANLSAIISGDISVDAFLTADTAKTPVETSDVGSIESELSMEEAEPESMEEASDVLDETDDEPKVEAWYVENPDEEPRVNSDPQDAFSFDDEVDAQNRADSGEYLEDDSMVPSPDDELIDISAEQVYQSVRRAFYSDELGLEVSAEPFDMQFIHGNDYIPLPEDRPEGWLNNFINEKCSQANVEMQRLHSDNLYRMKEFYLAAMAKHCEAIQKDLDTNDASTFYGQISDGLKATRIESTKKADETIVQRKTELNTQWEEKLAQIGEIAAQDAKNRYRDRFGRQHDEDVLHIAPVVRDEIEASFQSEMRDLNQRRKMDALKRLDYSVNETLTEVAVKYLACLEDEAATFRSLEKDIQDFIDLNRKDDIARAQALAEDLNQSNKADAVLAEYTEKMKIMTAEFDAKRQQAQADIDKIQRENELALMNKDAEWQRRYDESERDRTKKKEEISSLLQQYADLDAKKTQEFSAQINGLKSEKKAVESQCEHIIASGKRANRISVLLVVAAVIAAVAVGFVVGAFVYGKSMNESTNKAIVSEYNARMDALERNATETTVAVETTAKTSETTKATTKETEPTKSTSTASSGETTK